MTSRQQSINQNNWLWAVRSQIPQNFRHFFKIFVFCFNDTAVKINFSRLVDYSKQLLDIRGVFRRNVIYFHQ